MPWQAGPHAALPGYVHARIRQPAHAPAGTSTTKIHGMADPGKLRVSDQEREGAIEELREHTVAGRLTTEELDERLDAVYSAKTRADLDALRADLPISSAAARRALSARRSHLRRRLLQESGGSLTASLICVAIWIAAAQAAASGRSG